MNIQKELFKLQDKKYREFQAKLIPDKSIDSIIGIRTPDLKRLAKQIFKENKYHDFINDLPHKYYDEYMLHAFIISLIPDYDECLTEFHRLLPYVDNWAVCDQSAPKAFKKHKQELLKQIKVWIKSKETYTVRFAIKMLMEYLDEDFDKKYIKMVCDVKTAEYYINMMRAWYFATGLAKQYPDFIIYLENNLLDEWTHNKTIQKAIESYRISDRHKQYLKSLRIK